MYPPLPTHKLKDYSTGDCYIIPEIVYGMYDVESGILYRNPNYNPKYDPSGLVYDEETASIFQYSDMGWFDFMNERKSIAFEKLYAFDKQYGVFDGTCKFHGIKQDTHDIGIKSSGIHK